MSSSPSSLAVRVTAEAGQALGLPWEVWGAQGRAAGGTQCPGRGQVGTGTAGTCGCAGMAGARGTLV